MRRLRLFLFRNALLLALFLPRPALAAVSTPVDEALQRVQQLIQKGDLTEAQNQLMQALKQFPSEPGVYNLLGVVEAQQGNYQAAESNLKKAIVAAPRFTGAYLNLGHLYQENAGKDPGALQKGLDTYRKVLRFEPGNVEANYQIALLLERQGSFKFSLEHLSRLSAAEQEKPQALSIRCADLAGLGERASADAAARRLLAASTLTEMDVIPILGTLVAHHQSDLAIRLLEGLVERQLASADTFHQLAQLYKQQGRLNQARVTLEKVAQVQPVSTALLLELAHVAYQQRDYQGALGYLAHARDLEPQNAGVHFFFGMICVELNLAQEAYTSLKRAVSLNPNNPYYNYALGAVTVQRDEAREAIPYFQKYCEARPNDPRGKFALGAAYFYSHELDPAKKELEEVAKDRETAAGSHYFLGRIANEQGKLDLAEREIEQALEASPKYADARAELGLVHLKQKDYDRAEKELRKALELSPDSYTANLNLMILYQRTKDPRAEAQARRFEEVRKARAETAKEFLRTIEVRP